MASRQRHVTARCIEEGCTESAHWTPANGQEEKEMRQRLRHHPWRCSRHDRPGEVLSLAERTKVRVLVATRRNGHMYWREHGADHVSSGFAHGPGFRAWASDFPEGARLKVVAYIEVADPRDVTVDGQEV